MLLLLLSGDALKEAGTVAQRREQHKSVDTDCRSTAVSWELDPSFCLGVTVFAGGIGVFVTCGRFVVLVHLWSRERFCEDP